MTLELIISKLFYVINPLLYFPKFLIYAYHFFFFFNLGILLYLFFRNKNLLNYMRGLFKDTHIAIKILLVFVVFFHIFNCMYSMEPLNNLVPVTLEDIYKADVFYTKYYFTYFGTQTMGYPAIIAIAKLLSNADYIYILSVLGIFFSSLTIIMLFISIKHLTNNDFISLFGSMIYISLSFTVYHSCNCVRGLSPSSFFVSVLAFLYLTNSKKINTLRLILFCSTLLFYFRLENVIFIFIFVIYYIMNYSKNRLNLVDYIVAYLLFLPNTHYLANYKKMMNFQPGFIIGLSGVKLRLISFLDEFTTIVSLFFFILFLVGILTAIKKRRWNLLLLFTGLLMVYATFQVYAIFMPRHFFNLLPLVIIFICLGIFSIYSLNFKSIFKYFWRFLILFLILSQLIFGIEHNFFLKFDKDNVYIRPQLEIAELLQGSKLILYDSGVDVFSYKRFYNNSILLRKKQHNLTSYDYLLYFGENKISKYKIMNNLNLNLTLVNRSRIVDVYKIIR